MIKRILNFLGRVKERALDLVFGARYIYQFAVYTFEDAPTGTSVKLELFFKAWVSRKKEEQFEEKKDEFVEFLKEVLSVDSESDTFGDTIGWLKKEQTTDLAPSKAVTYEAHVLNINVKAKQKEIRTEEGVVDVARFFG